MPRDDRPNVDQPETDTPVEGETEGREDASKTRHADPGEDAAGWKAASEAAKDEPGDSPGV